MARPIRITVYRDNADRWRWRAVAGNGRKVGASEQSYASRAYARSKALSAYPAGELRG